MKQTTYTLHQTPGQFHRGVTVRELSKFLNSLPSGLLDSSVRIVEDPIGLIKQFTVEAGAEVHDE